MSSWCNVSFHFSFGTGWSDWPLVESHAISYSSRFEKMLLHIYHQRQVEGVLQLMFLYEVYSSWHSQGMFKHIASKVQMSVTTILKIVIGRWIPTLEHLNSFNKSGTCFLIIAIINTHTTSTFRATPALHIPCSSVLMALTISGYLASTPDWPDPAKAWRHAMFCFVASGHPFFMLLSIHLQIMPFLRCEKNWGWVCTKCFSIAAANQPTFGAMESIWTQRNGWYQFVCEWRVCLVPPSCPEWLDFQLEPGCDSLERSPSSFEFDMS